MKKFKFSKALTIVSFFAFMFGLVGPINVFAASPTPVNLGASSNFVILAKTGISTTGTTKVVGDIGVSPAQASYITGFDLILPAASAFSTSSLVNGKVYAPSYANPTPSNISTAVGDMQTAYTDAMGRAAGVTELGAGNIGGKTLAPGVYKWGTGVTITTDVTISGDANDVWIFQIAQNLDISSAKKIVLAGGSKASNIFWVVAGQTTIGTGAVFNGNILDQTAIVLNTGAVLNGRALAQTAVTLDANAVTLNSFSSTIFEAPIVSVSSPIIIPAVIQTSSSGSDMMYINNNPSTPSVSNNSEEGCSVGNMFNTSNGSPCKNNTIIKEGCFAGNLFNIINGHECTNNIKNIVTNYDFGTTTLKVGSKGEAVKALQALVGAEADGSFGPITKAKVIVWQKANGLDADGLFGSKSKAKFTLEIK